ncbi:MAG: DUF2892 domain-containing protein [Gammaproteobacteria bacterium]|nr:DUF2892 domain-containing protein [Gammaproteobacteria bacterium]
MKHNMGKTDRILRGLIGIGAISVGVYFQSWWGALGIIPLFTTVVSWCPIYLPFGISTCKKD